MVGRPLACLSAGAPLVLTSLVLTPRRHGNGGVARCWSGSPDDQKACLGDFIIQGSHPDGAPRPSPLHTAPGCNMCPLD